MKKILQPFLLSILFVLVFVGSIPTTLAAWNVYYPKTTEDSADVDEVTPLCFYNLYEDDGVTIKETKYFLSIELAVESANQVVSDETISQSNVDVIVFPRSRTECRKATIKKNITIKSGVTLNLGYDVDERNPNDSKQYLYRVVGGDNHFKTVDDNQYASFPDNQVSEKELFDSGNLFSTDTSVYSSIHNKILSEEPELTSIEVNDEKRNYYDYVGCTMSITLAENQTIAIEKGGALKIGGKQSGGSGGSSIAGHIITFAELKLSADSKIINNGTLTCFGYIVGSKEESSKLLKNVKKKSITKSNKDITETLSEENENNEPIQFREGSKVYLPFIVVEHRGGNNFFKFYPKFEGSPFNRFYLPNITDVSIGMEKNFVYGVADLWTHNPERHNHCYVNLIGDNDYYLLESSDFYIRCYYQSNLSMPSQNLDFVRGNFNLNSLELVIVFGSTFSINTKPCYFPISCYYSILFEKGMLVSNEQKIKLLPGSNMTIEDGYRMQLPGIAVYSQQTVKDIYSSKSSNIDDIGPYLKGVSGVIDYESNDDAICLVNGCLSAEYSSGLFQTSSTNAFLSFVNVKDTLNEVDNSKAIYDSSEQCSSGQTKVDDTITTVELVKNTCYGSSNETISSDSNDHYWNVQGEDDLSDYDIYFLSVVELNEVYNSEPGQDGDFSLKALPSPFNSSSISNVTFSWSFKTNVDSTSEIKGASFSSVNGQEVTFHAPANKMLSGDPSDIIYTITATLSFNDSDKEPITASINLTSKFIELGIVIKDKNDNDGSESASCYSSENNKPFSSKVEINWYANKQKVIYEQDESYKPFSDYFEFDSIEYCWGICANRNVYTSLNTDAKNAGISKFSVDNYGALSFSLEARKDNEEKLNYMVFLEVKFKNKESTIIMDIKAKKLKISGLETGVTYDSDGNFLSCFGLNYYAQSSYDPCLLPTSQILMSDGCYANAGDLKSGDSVMTFNHETGQFESSKVLFNDHVNQQAALHNVVSLYFSDGNKTDLVYEHGYFDLTLNKYVYIRQDNYQDYIGHEFVEVDSSCHKLGIKSTNLVSVNIHQEYTKVCSPATANNLNIISDNMLSMAGGLSGLFNIFEYEKDTLRFDPIKKQADIDKYGLLDYSYFVDYFSYEVYCALPCKYLGVSIGKGLITWDVIYSYIDKWGSQLVA